MKNTLSLILILTFCTISAFGQLYPFRTYSIEDGLSESVVNDMIQDSEGFLWMATGYGLNRFDGITIQNFFEDQGLKSSKVHSLFEDSKGRIWIGTEFGVNYWQDDSLYSLERLSALDNQRVISIFEDSNEEIWFGTDGAGAWLFEQDEQLIQYSTSQGFLNNRVRKIKESEDGSIWFATRGGLSVLSNGNIRTFTTSDGLPENRIRDIVFDENDELWIATREGLVHYKNDKFIVYDDNQGLNNVRVQTLVFDNNQRLWLGTEGGVSVFQDGRFKNFTIENGLSNNIIYSSILDREGNLWFGTFGGGANNETITNKKNINNPRGIIQMPSRVYSVNDVFEIGGFSGEDGGFGDYSFNAGDVDFSINKFIYSDVYGAGIGSENLMYYVVNSLFLDNTRQVLLPQISYSYNRLTKKFRFQGELPKRAVIFEIFSTIPDCNLFDDEAFQRYCIGQAKIQLARILGTFNFNLPGNITINYDLISSEGREEVDRIVEEIKGDEGVDYFFTG